MGINIVNRNLHFAIKILVFNQNLISESTPDPDSGSDLHLVGAVFGTIFCKILKKRQVL